MQYTIRQATAADLNLLDRIHTENMQGYVEQVYPWNPKLFSKNFIAKDYQAIEYRDRIIGLVKVVTSETEVYLAEIQIANEYQGRGIGTDIISQIIEQAKSSKQRLWLKVVQGNPAVHLYQKLGFSIYQTSLTHLEMAIDFRNALS